MQSARDFDRISQRQTLQLLSRDVIARGLPEEEKTLGNRQ